MTIKPKRRTWYSHPDLFAAFEKIRPLLDRFGQRFGYGHSMGGFAALTFADLLRLDRVVAISPQSTYRQVGAFREKRYPEIYQFDHSHPYGDAVEGCRNLPEAWILYDRFEPFDKLHAHRFKGPQFRFLRTPFLVHNVPQMLIDCAVHPMIPDLILYGNLNRRAFYTQLRRRRELDYYQQVLRRLSAPRPWLRRRVGALLGDDIESVERDIAAALAQKAQAPSRKNDQNLSQTK